MTNFRQHTPHGAQPYIPPPNDGRGSVLPGVVTSIMDLVHVNDPAFARVLAWLSRQYFRGVVVRTNADAQRLRAQLRNTKVLPLEFARSYPTPRPWWDRTSCPTARFATDPSVVQLPPNMEGLR